MRICSAIAVLLGLLNVAESAPATAAEGFTIECQAGKTSRKSETTIIPRMTLENCTFSEALDQLASLSQRLDSLSEGINMVGIDEDRAPRLTLKVPPNSRFIDVARLIAKSCDYEVQEDPWGVVFRPKGRRSSWVIREKDYMELNRLAAVVIDVGMSRVSFDEAIGRIRLQLEVAKTGNGKRLIVSPSAAAKMKSAQPKITIRSKIPLPPTEACRYVAEQAGLFLRLTKDAMIFKAEPTKGE